ncbi:MAG TPA: hypothetical protein VK501_00245 [Baekduia sp.]|uniref:hypothetical protein n=1 Tax=Baekduia sp. TaxID=2600305 RepID=UPI002C57C1D6|nr:hypothetical protein [Baekduia sp.]HMJ32315.1 hypothetical protein [Baekduia sp.]
MDRPPQPLTLAQRSRLVAIVERRAPALLPLAGEINRRWLSDEECEALSRLALNEFLDHLGPDDEPDRAGVDADELVGVLEMHRRGYWHK